MKLGVSIYPFKTKYDDMCEYLKSASDYGYNQVFTSLLGLDFNENDLEVLKNINEYASNLNMEVMVDVNEEVIEKFDVLNNGLKQFNDLHINKLRLDDPKNGQFESILSHNEFGIEIVFNASNDTSILDTTIDYGGDKKNISGCYNFYPLNKSGASIEYFLQCLKRYKLHNLEVSCFVTSQVGKIGPGYCEEGLPTLEVCRNMSIVNQYRLINAISDIDNIYIGNFPASNDELKQLYDVANSEQMINLEIELTTSLSELEREILFMGHFNRGDINECCIRSTQPRVRFKNSIDVEKNNIINNMYMGDIVIINSDMKSYQKELQLITKDFTISDKYYNLVARLTDDAMHILPYIKPWTKFRFILKEQK